MEQKVHTVDPKMTMQCWLLVMNTNIAQPLKLRSELAQLVAAFNLASNLATCQCTCLSLNDTTACFVTCDHELFHYYAVNFTKMSNWVQNGSNGSRFKLRASKIFLGSMPSGILHRQTLPIEHARLVSTSAGFLAAQP